MPLPRPFVALVGRMCLALILSCLSLQARAQLNNETSPTYQFKSRPDLHAPILEFAVLRPELLTPGYIFLAPYRNLDPGPYVYDNNGQLVWSGAGEAGPKTAHAPKVCKYKGEDHLCFFEGEQHQGFARGHGVIMDNSYRVVKIIDSSGAGASSDMHEFRMTPFSNGTTVLMTVYQPRQYDLTTNARYNLQHGLGWIVEGVFQEVDIETGKVVFEWRSLDHVDPSEAWTLPGATDTSGDGLHEQSPWDYFHINSIDKNEDGDYLISARHVSAIYKVSGQDGSIIWQLGGANPTFEQTNFQFSYQHHARWISENGTHTVFSFYDNASNNYNATGEFSHGWIIAIDHIASTATMIKEWGAPQPEGGLLSTSQGNMQLLPNGGAHIGWGEHAYFSEHLEDGTCVQYAKVADRASNVMIYRSNKFNWTAQPVTKPALWTYSKTGDVSTSFWVSWNGATEVKSWNFYVSETASGPWEFAGSVEKTGFETEFHKEKFFPWSYAEALDGDGRPLDASVVARTFVPSGRLRPWCNERGCDYNTRVPPEQETPYHAENNIAEKFLSTNRGYNTSHYYQDLPPVEESNVASDKTGSDSESEQSDESSSTSTMAVIAGLVMGATAATLGFFFWRNGVFRRLQGKTAELTDDMTSSSFGSKMLGRYTRVKDNEGFESGSSSSSGIS